MLSIIIPVYNEERRIGRCLEALMLQRTTEPMEVIVVDNASTDRTAAIASSFKDRLDVRVVHESHRTRGAARAAGCAAARGEFLFGIDADSIVPPGWAQAFIDRFASDPRIVGIAGLSSIDDCTPTINAVYKVFWPLSVYIFWLMHGYHSLSGHNFAVRRWAYDRAGGFDPTFDALEDVDLSQRIRKFGKTSLIRTPKILVSGRRFQHGFFRGWWEYIRIYMEIYWLKKGTVYLSSLQ